MLPHLFIAVSSVKFTVVVRRAKIENNLDSTFSMHDHYSIANTLALRSRCLSIHSCFVFY